MSNAVDTSSPWSACFRDTYVETKQRTNTMKTTHFRVKRMTLAAEARIIKAEEAKALRIARGLAKSNLKPLVASHQRNLYHSLRIHRIHVVRPAARAMHLAHAYLKGMEYARVENPTKLHAPVPVSVVKAAAENVRKFGGPAFVEVGDKQITMWMDGWRTVKQIADDKAAELDPLPRQVATA